MKNELENITGNTETPLKAANAYSDIIKGLDTVKEIINNSTIAANNAVEMVSTIRTVVSIIIIVFIFQIM